MVDCQGCMHHHISGGHLPHRVSALVYIICSLDNFVSIQIRRGTVPIHMILTHVNHSQWKVREPRRPEKGLATSTILILQQLCNIEEGFFLIVH